MLQRKQLFFGILFLSSIIGTSSFSMDNNKDNNKPSLLRKAAGVGVGGMVAKTVLAYTIPYIGVAHAVAAAGYSGYQVYKATTQDGTSQSPFIPKPSEEKKD